MKSLIILFTLVPFLSFSQKLKVNEYDRFTKQRRIELEPLRVYSAENANLNLSYNSFGRVLYLQLSGFGWGASAIDEGQKLIFLFSNDSTVSVSSTDVQTAEMNSSFQTAYKHSYFIRLQDIKLMSEFEVVGIRKYALGDHFDLQVSKENALKIKNLSSLFLEELKIANIFRPMQDIDVRDIAKHIGDSVRFCTKVYNTRYFESVRNKPTVLDVKNNYNSPLNIVIWEADRQNFYNAPETLYNNKDVCITGLVETSNNIPQIVVRNRDQITIKSPISLAEVDKFEGDSVTVSGQVVTAKHVTNTSTSPTVLNLTGALPDQMVTIVINNKDRGNFSSSPETYYLNKAIRVTGKVEMVEGKPQIIVQGKDQITEVSHEIVQQENKLQQGVQGTNSNDPVSRQTSASTSSQTKSIEQPASFPGGQDALLTFLQTNLIAPEDELQLGEKKVVIAKFVINPDGTASDIEITQPAGINFDKEVLRVLKMMPKWEPQMTNGTAVPVSVTQPITFVRKETEAKRRTRS